MKPNERTNSTVKDRSNPCLEDPLAEGAWVGVDLDGTLAYYRGWNGPTHIGKPVPAMLARVLNWINLGIDVRIFTARVSSSCGADAEKAREAIKSWSIRHIGRELPITCEKDIYMVELWDDRAYRVKHNEGELESRLTLRHFDRESIHQLRPHMKTFRGRATLRAVFVPDEFQFNNGNEIISFENGYLCEVGGKLAVVDKDRFEMLYEEASPC